MELERPKRGEIWHIENNNFVGSEAGYTRPAVIVSNDKNNLYSGVVEVVYLTTQKRKELPTHIRIRSAPRMSTALCEQVYSVSLERLKEKCGEVTDNEQTMIDQALLISLGINEITTPQNRVKERTDDTKIKVNTSELKLELAMYKRMYNDILERITK